MKRGTEITVEEWLKEIEALNRTEPEGHTANELAHIWGVHVHLARERIRQASHQGWVTVDQKPIQAIDGRKRMAPCYQFHKPKEGKK